MQCKTLKFEQQEIQTLKKKKTEKKKKITKKVIKKNFQN